MNYKLSKMSAKFFFIYIIGSNKNTYKFGYTLNPYNRIKRCESDSNIKHKFVKLYLIEKTKFYDDNIPYKLPDNLFTKLHRNKCFHRICKITNYKFPLLSNVGNMIANNTGLGCEQIQPNGVCVINDIIHTEFDKLGLNLLLDYKNIDEINDYHIHNRLCDVHDVLKLICYCQSNNNTNILYIVNPIKRKNKKINETKKNQNIITANNNVDRNYIIIGKYYIKNKNKPKNNTNKNIKTEGNKINNVQNITDDMYPNFDNDYKKINQNKICIRCGQSFKKIKEFRMHLVGTKNCKATYINVPLKIYRLNMKVLNGFFIIKFKELYEKNKKILYYGCEYCGKMFESRKYYFKHKKYHCKIRNTKNFLIYVPDA